ncbi:MAG: hypothetical protein S0880_09530 [Actinomycetota bacterium]|nr:hypothetical protein [Actinomycetota bacterium]
MSDIAISLKEAMTITGAIGAALVDYDSGMTLGTAGGAPDLDLEVAAAGNTEVVRAKMHTMRELGINETIEDILLTLGTQYHLIRPVRSHKGKGLFLYLALRKEQANLAMARRQLMLIEEQLSL